MVSMYPHKLYVVSVSSSRNADGYVVSSEGNETFLGNCRLETSGRASQHIADDGEQVYSSATIYMPRLNGSVGSGSLVVVRDSYGNELMKKTVINCSVTQLHARIWV